jgi:hypothetical protein
LTVLIGLLIGVAIAGAIVVVLRTDLTGETTAPPPAYLYDIKGYRKTDPKLVRFHEVGTFATEMKEPRAIAIDAQDRIYVAGDKAIRVFRGDKDGLADYRQIPLSSEPHCLTVTSDGTLYVGMKDHVEVYDPKGERKAAWESLGDTAVLTSIAISAEHVFVADAGHRVVFHCDTSGKLLGRIGKKDPNRNIPGFIIPSPYFDVAVGPDGLLWAANTGRHRLEGYTFNGDLEISWGKPSMDFDGFSGCCNPANFTILPDGRFVTAEKGLPRVKICKPDGTLECVVAGPEQFAEDTHLDVAADSQGRILVLDPSHKSVRLFARNGAR